MECVICKKSFTIELSVCPSCGAMQQDSVREELVTFSSPKNSYLCYEKSLPDSEEILLIPEPAELEMIFVSSEPEILSKPEVISKDITPELISENEKSEAMPNKPNPQNAAKKPNPQIAQAQHIQPKSENLVEFQQRNNVIPEWRIQLKNAVREKMNSKNIEHETSSTASSSNRVLRTQGNAALKIAPVIEEEVVIEETPSEKINHENQTVQNALKRIELSRMQYFVKEESQTQLIEKEKIDAQEEAKKEYPFELASSKTSGELRPAKKNSIVAPPRPMLVSSLRKGKEDFDTNKLPPLPQPARVVSSLQTRPVQNVETIAVEKQIIEAKIEPTELIAAEITTTEIATIVEEKIIIEDTSLSEDELKMMVNAEAEEEYEKNQEIEDFAPFASRFNAGVFDLLIGSFTSMILLSYWLLFGSGEWFSLGGFFAFASVTAVVMFIYLTTSVGMFGKTFGMRIFSLEIIDIENEDYPSFHQAAVSSAVYLASISLGGLGFLTVPFNEDQRAVHDLVSNTLIVREL